LIGKEREDITKGNPEVRNRLSGKVIIPAGKYGSLKEAVEEFDKYQTEEK